MNFTNSLKTEQKLYQAIINHLQEEDKEFVNEKEIIKLAYKYFNQWDILLPQTEIEKIIYNVTYAITGFGPLEILLRDDSISEIMVNGADNIFVEKNGQINKTDLRFLDDKQLMQVIGRIVGQVGRRIDESVPLVDARLADGSRVNAIIPPLSLIGPVLTIRKFPKKSFNIENLLNNGSINTEMKMFLEHCVINKKNMVISGGTGAGKTSTLNALASLIPQNERIITIEDSAEINIHHNHLISLESRIANLEGKGEISIRTLLKNALRMRPDRIVIGEIRGGEAIDMLQAMNTGHSGSLTTVHANSPLESLYRIETMVLMGEIDIPLSAIRPQIIQGIDIVIQQSRLSTGERKIVEIAQMNKSLENANYQMQTVFKYDQAKNLFINMNLDK